MRIAGCPYYYNDHRMDTVYSNWSAMSRQSASVVRKYLCSSTLLMINHLSWKNHDLP